MSNLNSPPHFFKCLGDETRLRILLLLSQDNELCVCELTTALDEIQPKISRHLAYLRQCGLLQDERRGQWVFYCLSPAVPQWAKEVLLTVAANNQALIHDDLQRLQAMANRPESERLC